jgi:hypothetical protein
VAAVFSATPAVVTQYTNFQASCDATFSVRSNITNVVSQSTRCQYTVSTINVGDTYYCDRSYTFVSVPSFLQGAEHIRTANDDKHSPSSNPAFLCFDLRVASTVYVLYDSRVQNGHEPGWLLAAHDQHQTATLEVTDSSMGTFEVWYSDHSAGTVCIGGNEAPGVGSNYLVAVVPRIAAHPPQPPRTPGPQYQYTSFEEPAAPQCSCVPNCHQTQCANSGLGNLTGAGVAVPNLAGVWRHPGDRGWTVSYTRSTSLPSVELGFQAYWEQCNASPMHAGLTFGQHCGPGQGMITDMADCRAAAGWLTGTAQITSAGPEWASGCLWHNGGVYYSPHADGSTQNPTDGYICKTASPLIVGAHCLPGHGMIDSAAACQAAAAVLGVQWAAMAGPEWASGCLYNNGAAYYSPHVDGTTQNPTDAYICNPPPSKAAEAGLPACTGHQDSNDMFGVISDTVGDHAWGAGGVAHQFTTGIFPHGNHCYMMDDTDGFGYVTVDPVDVSAMQFPVASIWVHIDSTSYEAQDAVRVWVQCSSGSTIEVLTGVLDDEAHPTGASGAQLVENRWVQHAAPLGRNCGTATLSFGAQTDSSSEEIWFDMVEFYSARLSAGSPRLIIKGVLDLDLPRSTGKAIELKALEYVPDLSMFALGIANNGHGTDGMEVEALPQISLQAGETFWVVYNARALAQYFGGDSVFATGTEHIDYIIDRSVNQNGNDAIELFFYGDVVDVFGDVNVDGTNTPWEYKDSWAYRTTHDLNGSHTGAVFNVADWHIPGTPGDECSDGSTSNCASRCGSYPAFAATCPTHQWTCDGTVANGGFELDVVPNYVYMTPADWSAGGGGGTVIVPSGNGPWGGLRAPNGSYYLSIQNHGNGVEQAVCGLLPNTDYVLSFWLTHRPGYGDDENVFVPSPRHNYHDQNSAVTDIYLRFMITILILMTRSR